MCPCRNRIRFPICNSCTITGQGVLTLLLTSRAMRQVPGNFRCKHRRFTFGFLPSRRRHNRIHKFNLCVTTILPLSFCRRKFDFAVRDFSRRSPKRSRCRCLFPDRRQPSRLRRLLEHESANEYGKIPHRSLCGKASNLLVQSRIVLK